MKLCQFRISFQPSGKIYGFTGKVAQGAFLGLLKKEGDMTADVLHFGNKRRPYSLTPIKVATPSFFDVTSLNQELSTHLSHILENFNEKTIQVSNREEHLLPPEIKTAYLTPQPVTEGTRIQMQFWTPVLFSSNERKARTDPYPHLDRLWGDLIKVWNLQSEDTIDAELTHSLLQQLSTPFFNFRSVRIKLGQIRVTGFTGKITFHVEDGTGLEYLLPLARLAGYFGIGGKKAMGFGRVHVRIQNEVKEDRRTKNSF